MKSFDEIRTAGFSDPSTVQGAILYGICFALYERIAVRDIQEAIVAAAIISASEAVDFMEFGFFCIDGVFNTGAGDTISDEGFSRYGV